MCENRKTSLGARSGLSGWCCIVFIPFSGLQVVTSVVLWHYPVGTTIAQSSAAEISFHLLLESFQNSKVMFLIGGLTLRNPFNMNELLRVEEGNGHGLFLNLLIFTFMGLRQYLNCKILHVGTLLQP